MSPRHYTYLSTPSWCWNSASVRWCQIESQRQGFAWSRKEQLYCFARQRGTQWAIALKTLCPNLGDLVMSFIAMVQGVGLLIRIRVCAGPAFIPLIWPQVVSWWASVVLTLSKVVNIFHLLGVLVLQKSSKILLRLSLEVEPGPCPQAALLFLDCFSLVFESLAAVWTCPLELTEGHGGWSLFPTNKKWGAQKGFHAWEPHRVLLGFTPSLYCFSIPLIWFLSQ